MAGKTQPLDLGNGRQIQLSNKRQRLVLPFRPIKLGRQVRTTAEATARVFRRSSRNQEYGWPRRRDYVFRNASEPTGLQRLNEGWHEIDLTILQDLRAMLEPFA